jgi:ribosomal RNA-processing protein 8
MTVHSFDLISPHPLVQACDIANFPLPTKSVTLSIFCLSLMGTNFMEFIMKSVTES